jgi:sugar O-acyltransferase (sialic acid O-acetyltransferase NeuD family)
MSRITPVVIIGAGGFAREVLDIFDAINAQEPQFEVLGYIVQPAFGSPGQLINDRPILGDFDWLAERSQAVKAICAVGAPETRFRLIREASKHGVHFCNAIHPSAIMTKWIEIAEGVVITAGCILTNQIKIGNHVHINLDCTIGHDARIDDFSTLAPGVHVSGNVHLQSGCYIGTGANIIEKITVGAWSIIGAGSTIISDVPPNTTVVGVPGKVIKTRPEGWHEN